MSGQSQTGANDHLLARLAEKTNVEYDPDSKNVEFTGPENDTEHYINLVVYLASEGYLTSSNLPITASQAQTRYLINSTPQHENRDMVRPVEITSDIHLETNHDSKSKKRYSKQFIENLVLADS